MEGVVIGNDRFLGQLVPEVEIIDFRGVLCQDALVDLGALEQVASTTEQQGPCKDREACMLKSSCCALRRNN